MELRSGFPDAVNRALAFLGRSGYEETERRQFSLTLKSAVFGIVVTLDPSLGELDADVVLLHTGDKSSLSELLRADPGGDVSFPLYVSASRELNSALEMMAQALETRLSFLVSGDAAAFANVYGRVVAQRAKDTDDAEHGPTRVRAEEAWHKRDLQELICLYETLGDRLSATERARLEYARRKLQSVR